MKNSILPGIILSAFLLAGCQQKTDSHIMTVQGLIPASEMGITLSHEHVLVDFIGADSSGYHRWDRQEVMAKVLPFLTEKLSPERYAEDMAALIEITRPMP